MIHQSTLDLYDIVEPILNDKQRQQLRMSEHRIFVATHRYNEIGGQTVLAEPITGGELIVALNNLELAVEFYRSAVQVKAAGLIWEAAERLANEKLSVPLCRPA